MRISIKVDSATPTEVYDLTLAFQRTSKDHGLPQQITDTPTVRVMGTAMEWQSPALTPLHAADLLNEYHNSLPPEDDEDDTLAVERLVNALRKQPFPARVGPSFTTFEDNKFGLDDCVMSDQVPSLVPEWARRDCAGRIGESTSPGSGVKTVMCEEHFNAMADHMLRQKAE